MSDHKHKFCVDTECECGIKLSVLVQQLQQENERLRIALEHLNMHPEECNDEEGPCVSEVVRLEQVKTIADLRAKVQQLEAELREAKHADRE